jgi:hypothetical protein
MAVFVRIRDDGSWGVRGPSLRPGQKARVERRDGSVTWVTVGEVVWRASDGRPDVIARVVGERGRRRPRRRDGRGGRRRRASTPPPRQETAPTASPEAARAPAAPAAAEATPAPATPPKRRKRRRPPLLGPFPLFPETDGKGGE